MKYFIFPLLIGDKLEELRDTLNRKAGIEKWQEYKGLYAAQIDSAVLDGIRNEKIHIRHPPAYRAVKITLPYTFDNERDLVEWGEVRTFLTEQTTCGFPETPPWAPQANQAQILAPEEPRTMKKAALIAKLEAEGFSAAESAFRHSEVNGLRHVAKAEKFGYWRENETIAWFEQNQPRSNQQNGIQAPMLGGYSQLQTTTHKAK